MLIWEITDSRVAPPLQMPLFEAVNLSAVGFSLTLGLWLLFNTMWQRREHQCALKPSFIPLTVSLGKCFHHPVSLLCVSQGPEAPQESL